VSAPVFGEVGIAIGSGDYAPPQGGLAYAVFGSDNPSLESSSPFPWPLDASLEAGVVTMSDNAGHLMTLAHGAGADYALSGLDVPTLGDVLYVAGAGSSDVPAFSLATRRPSPLTFSLPDPSIPIPANGKLSFTWSTVGEPHGFLTVIYFGRYAAFSRDYPLSDGKVEIAAADLPGIPSLEDTVTVLLSTSCNAYATQDGVGLVATFRETFPTFTILLVP
jgi:hypothetical protein